MKFIKHSNNAFPIHGGNIADFCNLYQHSRQDIIDFSSNINPLGVADSVIACYHRSVSELAIYPDPYATNLCQVIAQKLRLENHNIVAGNGAIALLELAIRCILPTKTLIVEPCFNEYKRLLERYNSEIISIPLASHNSFAFPLQNIVQQLNNIDLILLANPNNPTGTALEKTELLQLLNLAADKNVKIIIDEAFIDWCASCSITAAISDFDNVIVVHSLTKFYALPGIRIGYACACAHWVTQMQSLQETWSCNAIAQNLAVTALKDEHYQLRSIEWMQEEKEYLLNALKEIPYLHVYPSLANYYLCQIEESLPMESMQEFWQHMGQAGLYLRFPIGFNGLSPRFFRLAVKSRPENQRLVSALSMFCQLPAIKQHANAC